MPDADAIRAKEIFDEALEEMDNWLIADEEQERIADAQKQRYDRLRKMLDEARAELDASAARETYLGELVVVGQKLAHLETEGLEQSRVQHADLVDKLRRPYSVEQYINPEAQDAIGLDLAEAKSALLPTAGSVVPTSSIRTARRVNTRVQHEQKAREHLEKQAIEKLIGPLPAD